MVCVKCQKEIPEGSLFCPWCGKRQSPAPRTRKRRTSGSGSICKLTGNRKKPYIARLNGITIGTFSTVKEADRALARLVDIDITDKYNWTFAQVYNAWKPEHEALLNSRAEAKGTHTTGMQSYTTAYRYCAPLHDKPIRQLRKADLQAILSGMAEQGLSHSSISKVRQLMSQLYQWAMAEQIVQANLTTVLEVAPPKKSSKQVFTPEEVQAIASCPMPAAKIAILLLCTGCRIGELFSVRLEDCHDGYFISGSKTEAGVRRTIPVIPLGLPAYNSLRQSAIDNHGTRLIDGYDGNRSPGNWRKREYYPMLDSLGISRDKTPHKTRHTYATAAVSSGVNPEDLKNILGHASYTTTINIYDHRPAESLISAASTIDLTTPTPTPPAPASTENEDPP